MVAASQLWRSRCSVKPPMLQTSQHTNDCPLDHACTGHAAQHTTRGAASCAPALPHCWGDSLAHLQIAWKPVCELLGVLGYLVVQVDGSGVLEPFILLIHRSLHLGVTVPHTDCHDARKCLHAESDL